MRRFIVCLFVLMMTTGISVYGQKDSSAAHIRENSFFIEAGGNAVESGEGWIGEGWWQRYSVNYDRILYDNKTFKTTLRIGSNFPFKGSHHIIPLLLNVLIGKKIFYFEFGAGCELIFYEKYKFVDGVFTSVLGFRYQRFEKGIMARIGFTPTIGFLPGEIYIGSLAGFSLGYSF